MLYKSQSTQLTSMQKSTTLNNVPTRYRNICIVYLKTDDGKDIGIFTDRAHVLLLCIDFLKGHGGVYVTMGSWAVNVSFTRKNSRINAVSLIEIKVIPVGEELPKYLSFRNFTVEQ